MRRADIEIFSDFTCPWCYITKHRLEAAVRSLPANISCRIYWRPFTLVRRGERDSAAEAFLTRIGAAEGITFAFDRIVAEPDTLNARRLVWLAQYDEQRNDRATALVERIYRAHFTEGRDIAAMATLAAVAGESGMDFRSTERWLSASGGVHEVRELERGARTMGVDTIPFMLINGTVGIRGTRTIGHLVEKIQGASWFSVDRPAGSDDRGRTKEPIAPTLERRAVEAMIDDTLSDTFPASDAPTWGAPARRLRLTEV